MTQQDKRGDGRAKKRVMVKFGVDQANRMAFTRNVSDTGVFLQTNHVFKPGTTIQVKIELDERTFNMWSRVVWAKKVPPQLAHVLQCGMGLCFIDPSPEWLEYFIRWREKHG